MILNELAATGQTESHFSRDFVNYLQDMYGKEFGSNQNPLIDLLLSMPPNAGEQLCAYFPQAASVCAKAASAYEGDRNERERAGRASYSSAINYTATEGVDESDVSFSSDDGDDATVRTKKKPSLFRRIFRRRSKV